MSDKFQDRFRIPSARAPWWNYGWNAAYFVTICTAHREHYFGEIIDGNDNDETGHFVETGQCPVSTNPINVTNATDPHHSKNIDFQPAMQLSEIGRLAEKFWWSIPEHFSFVKLDVFVVIPNHIHGILIIAKTNNEHKNKCIDDADSIDGTDDIGVETGQCPVSTTNCTVAANPATEPKTQGELRFRNQGKGTLSSIIGSYKSVVTRHAHRIHADFEWQERFYDHIIRDEEEYYRIANYIENNVDNWQDDKFYTKD